jgi:hypothetical protein
MKRKINESSDQETLKEIERTYGKKVREALVKYCEKKGLDITQTVYDTKTDGNGQTPWDKFDNWAETKLGLDVMGGFDDTDIDDILGFKGGRKGADDIAKGRRSSAKIYDRPSDSDIYGEGSGSRMDMYAISDNIWDYLEDCEWVENLDQVHYESFGNEIVFTVDGQNYIITIDKCE